MKTQPFPPGSLVAAYFRDSGGETQDLSISQQEAHFKIWLTENGLAAGAVFRDAARPGSSVAGRQAFHDMMHHFRNGATEAGLVIWSYSRFARDFDDAQFYRADIRRRGYLFYSLFQSTPPAWGATATYGARQAPSTICCTTHPKFASIHLLKIENKLLIFVIPFHFPANPPINLCPLGVRIYTISGPSRSMLAFAPICSTRFRHSSPR